MKLPSTKELAAWVGRPYAEGSCWDPFARDAFREIRGVELPASYYDALPLFETVHVCRHNAPPFTPEPWDVVMLRCHRFLVLHCAIALDGERFIHPWETGLVICHRSDEQWSRRIAGYLRLKKA